MLGLYISWDYLLIHVLVLNLRLRSFAFIVIFDLFMMTLYLLRATHALLEIRLLILFSVRNLNSNLVRRWRLSNVLEVVV